MSKSGANTPVIQDAFLNEIRKRGISVTIFLVNGFQLKGTIKSFDNFTVMLESGERQMLVYKHAMSTVIPSRPVMMKHGEETAEETGEETQEETRGK